MRPAALPSCAASFPKSLATFSPPRSQQPSFLLDNHRAEMFGLALSNKALQGTWMRIYDSEEDGLSFNRWGWRWGWRCCGRVSVRPMSSGEIRNLDGKAAGGNGGGVGGWIVVFGCGTNSVPGT